MSISAILPIDGVPEALLRAVNDRFRQLDQSTSAVNGGGSSGLVSSAKIYKATFAMQPTPNLGVQDAGFLWYVSDYNHLLRWTQSGWEFVDEMGGYIVGRVVVPDGNGWKLCDGSATHYLHIAAGIVSEVAYTTPNLNSNPAYLKWASTYTGSIVAATAPSLGSASRGTATPLTPNALTDVHADAEPQHLIVLPYFRR